MLIDFKFFLIFVLNLILSIPAFCHTGGQTEMYVIGDFNDWQLPDEKRLNGAVPLTMTSSPNEDREFQGKMYFPKGDTKFTVVFYEIRNTTPLFGATDTNEIELFDYSGPADRPENWINPHYIDLYEENINSAISFLFSWQSPFDSSHTKYFTIKNWVGGEIEFLCLAEGRLFMNSDQMPPYKLAVDNNIVYALTQIDDAKPQLIELPYFRSDHYKTSHSFIGKKIKMILTSEKSFNPDPDNCWGQISENIYNETLNNANSKGMSYVDQLVRGGHPIVAEFRTIGTFGFMYDWVKNIIDVITVENEPIRPIHVKVSSDGIESEFISPILPETCFTEEIKVTGKEVKITFLGEDYVGEDIYYGPVTAEWEQLHSPDSYPNECYFKEKLGYNNSFYGYFEESGTLTARISPYYGICYYSYEENGQPTAGFPEMILEKPNSTDPVTSRKILFYDMSGRLISQPEKGIYIKKVGEKIEKVMIH